MPDITIPNKENGKWGLQRTYNIDLESNPGNIVLSRLVETAADTNTAGDSALGIIDAFIRTNADNIDRQWALSRNGKLFRTDSGDCYTSWKEDTLANSPTDAKDMDVHENDPDSATGENRLLVTRDSDIASLNDTANNAWNANWWITAKTQPALIKGVPHPIEYFPLRRISLIGDANFIHIVDKSGTISNKRLIFPPYLRIEYIFNTTYRNWILCSGKFGRNGAVVEWDGYSESYNNIYDIQSTYPLSGVNYYEIPIVINNKGLILEFNGNGFSPMIRNGRQIVFPCYLETGNAFLVSTIPAIAPRGMTVTDDGVIHINVAAPARNSNRQLGGIWCLNPNTGDFYSKYSVNDSDDYGHQGLHTPGAIKAVNIPSTIANSIYLMMGAHISSDGATKSKIWIIKRQYDSTERRGYFITEPFLTNNIQEMWDTVWLKFTAFRNANDKIIIKAKGVKSLLSIANNNVPLSYTGTWTSATTFTITLGATDDSLQAGDEIEVTGGDNAGVLAHITEIVGAHGALQTITIDESVTDIAGTATIAFDRWKKLAVIDNSTKYFAPVSIGIQSTFVQFKVEMRGGNMDYYISELSAQVNKQVSKKR